MHGSLKSCRVCTDFVVIRKYSNVANVLNHTNEDTGFHVSPFILY